MGKELVRVHPDARIGDNVTIEPFTYIDKDVEIGEGTWIGPNVTIFEGARIGKNCKIFPGAVISAIPQDLKFKGEVTTAIIGDNSVVRECVTVNRGTTDKYKTELGKNCLIMAYSHIGHDCQIGNNVIISNAAQLAGHVQIGDCVNLGGTSAVRQFVKIGSYAMVAGGSLVRKDVPPYTKAAREPLSYCGINSIGLRRRGFQTEKITEIQEIYRHIYLSGMNISKAVEYLESNIPASKERDEIISFIRNSQQGVMKGYV